MSKQVSYAKQGQDDERKRHLRTLDTTNSPAQASQPAILQRFIANPGGVSPADLLSLQHAVGNHSFLSLITSQRPAPPSQSNLTVGAPNDQYEQEADRIAEQVTRSAPTPGVTPAAGTTPALQKSEQHNIPAGPKLESQLTANKGGGKQLPADIRARMESRFAADFSAVRIHTGPSATSLNHQLGSHAFTYGKDIYLGASAGTPGTSGADRLLAHELTHTLQQGATNHVRGWWPKGHREVTELAVQEGLFSRIYGPRAIRMLIDRSPDIDFIQDQIDTMNSGIQQAKPRLDLYNKLIQTNQKAAALRMWNNNELHMRRPEYMLSHGEGGRYKVPDASTKNEAMTSRLVHRAANAWNWADPASKGRSLAVLGDALHQAEDRGSHGEGNAFSGHDVRLGLSKWLKDQKRPAEAWEHLPPTAPRGNWEPDNFSVNKKGGLLGVAFAQGVLTKFAGLVQASNARPVELEGQDDNPTGVPEKRKMKAKPFLPAVPSNSEMSRLVGKTGGSLEDLNKIYWQERAKTPDAVYRRAKAIPSELHSEGSFRAHGGDLDKGMDFYKRGIRGLRDDPNVNHQTEAQVMTKAYLQFKEWGKYGSAFGRGVSKGNRVAYSKQYYRDEVAKYRGNARLMAKRAIKNAYKAAFGTTLAV